MSGGLAFRLAVQAAYFVLLARQLGPQEFGTFAAVTAAASLCSPFVGWGMGNILVKYVARNNGVFAGYWGAALVAVWTSGLLLTVAALFVADRFLPPSVAFSLILWVALADLVFASISSLCGQGYQAFERLDKTAKLVVMASVFRGLGALGFVLMGGSGASSWAFIYAVASGASAGVSLWLVRRDLGEAAPAGFKLAKLHFREGVNFAILVSAQNAMNDLDKVMLFRLAGNEVAGVYAAAYRLVEAAFTPVRGLLYASYARFFRMGGAGLSGSLAMAIRVVPYALAYGTVAAILLWVAADFIPVVIGAKYEVSAEVLRWLVALIPLRAAFYLAADTLLGADYRGGRTAIQILGVALLLGMYQWLIPIYGWPGAAISAVAGTGVVAAGAWLLIWVKGRARLNGGS